MDEENYGHPVRKINCARGCGWYRAYTDTWAWKTRVIDHPQWGEVTGEQAVQKDVFHHDCVAFLEARARFREKLGHRTYDSERLRAAA